MLFVQIKQPPPVAYILSFTSHLHLNVSEFNSYISEDKDKKSLKKLKLLSDWKWEKGDPGLQDTPDEFIDCPSFCLE